jgi:hypothetical protein
MFLNPFITHRNTIKMSSAKEYALLCLENPLLGMCLCLLNAIELLNLQYQVRTVRFHQQRRK